MIQSKDSMKLDPKVFEEQYKALCSRMLMVYVK